MEIVIKNLKERKVQLEKNLESTKNKRSDYQAQVDKETENIEWFIKAIDETEQAIKVLEK